jgi:thioredoxin 1
MKLKSFVSLTIIVITFSSCNMDPEINSASNGNKPVVAATGEIPQSSGLSFDEYLSKIKASDKLVLVDFNAVWCGPCKIVKPVVGKVVKDNTGKLELLDIDVDKNPIVANNMKVQGIPLLILYKGGKEVWRNMGLIDEADLSHEVKKFLK